MVSSKWLPRSFFNFLFAEEIDRNIIIEALREIEDSARIDGKDCITFYNQTDEEIYVYFSTGTG